MSESPSPHERTPLIQTESDLIKTGGTDVYGTETLVDEEIRGSRPSSSSSSQTPTSSPGVAPSVVVLVLTIGTSISLNLVDVLLIVPGVFIAQLDTSFVLATHSNIASDFGQLANSSWLVTSYALAMCAVQPIVCIPSVFGQKACKC